MNPAAFAAHRFSVHERFTAGSPPAPCAGGEPCIPPCECAGKSAHRKKPPGAAFTVAAHRALFACDGRRFLYYAVGRVGAGGEPCIPPCRCASAGGFIFSSKRTIRQRHPTAARFSQDGSRIPSRPRRVRTRVGFILYRGYSRSRDGRRRAGCAAEVGFLYRVVFVGSRPSVRTGSARRWAAEALRHSR